MKQYFIYIIVQIKIHIEYAENNHFSGVGQCPFLGILNITFKYLLEIRSPIVGWCETLGHLPTPVVFSCFLAAETPMTTWWKPSQACVREARLSVAPAIFSEPKPEPKMVRGKMAARHGEREREVMLILVVLCGDIYIYIYI